MGGIERADEGGPGQPYLTKLDEAIWLPGLGLGRLGQRCLVFGTCGGFASISCLVFLSFNLALGIVGAPNAKMEPNIE